MAVHTLANLDDPAFTGVPTADTAAVGTNTTQLATTAFVDAALATMQAASTLYGYNMFESGGGSVVIAANTRVPVMRTVNATASYLLGILGPFPDGGTVTGFKLRYMVEADESGNTVDLAVYLGAYAPGDSLLTAAPPNEGYKGTMVTQWSLATPTDIFELTEEDADLDSADLIVAPGDEVTVYIYRNGTADDYDDYWDLFSIELVWA